MSKSNDNNDNSYNDSPGYFYGIPVNPKMNMDEDIEEVTRKIAPTMVMPSLGPLPTMPPNTGGRGAAAPTMGMAIAPTIDTSSMKAPPMLGRYGLGYGFGLVQQPKQQQQEKIPSSRFVWNLPSVPSLPEFHPLERTAVFVPNTMPSVIASRISSVLRERSIEAQYDNAKAKVKCTTAEGVDFRIRLYRGRGRYNHGIIVEVQRRFGTSLVFHADTEAILDVAQEKFPPPAPPSLSAQSLMNNNNLPEATDDDDNDDDYYGSSSSYAVVSADSSLAMVAKMMKLPGFDSQYLGLQTLTPLVDSDKLSLSTAQAVATKLLQPENEVGIKVFSYIVNNRANGNSKVEGKKKKSRGVFDDDDDDDDDSMILRNMCLNILANSLRAYGKVPDFLLREPLRPALLQDLKDAEKHPNTALLSAKCMEYFAQVDHNYDHDTSELCEAFEIAQKVGEARHANLMRQAQKCMIAIR